MSLFNYFNKYNKLYYFFTYYFNQILNLEINEKLIFIIYNNHINNNNIIDIININNLNFRIEINKHNLYQSFYRFIYKQNKQITIFYLNLLFNEYDKLINSLNNDNNNNNNNLINIIIRFRKLNNEIIVSIIKLKITYKNIDIDNNINKYIEILLKL